MRNPSSHLPIPSAKSERLAWLRNFLDEEHHESVSLDYKDGTALNNTFKKFLEKTIPNSQKSRERSRLEREYKEKLTRHVTGIANAEGGLLIYGIIDPKKSQDGSTRFSPVDGKECDVENIDKMLDEIDPPIKGCRSIRIDLDEIDHLGGCCVVIEIPKSPLVHQAINGAFYIRRGTQTKIMKTDEVRQAMNRSRYPLVSCDLSLQIPGPMWMGTGAPGSIRIRITNSSEVFCSKYYLRILFPLIFGNFCTEVMELEFTPLWGPPKSVRTPKGTALLLQIKGVDLFPDETRSVIIPYSYKDGTPYSYDGSPREWLQGEIGIEISADDMPKKRDWVSLEEAAGRWRGPRAESSE
ncbi:MAG: hypothetical protein JWM59_1165 [Verrucomicrobiales bacterium]|nr:hypothetical protein [Verrucomicrobiales bacterium]